MKIGSRLARLPAGRGRAGKCVFKARGEEGNSLVEMAFVLPLLIMILMGSASFSLAFYSLQQLQEATATAVRVVGALQGQTEDPCAAVQTMVQSALPGWTTAKLSYAMIITNASGTAYNYPASGMTSGAGSYSCQAGAVPTTGLAAGEPVQLKVQYSYTWIPIPGVNLSSPLTATETAMAD
jgi:Flp pilus assembly protein TadG